MRIYKLTQTDNTGYDTYSAAIVVAEDAAAAVLIHPAAGKDIHGPIAWDPAFVDEWGDDALGCWVEDHGHGYRAMFSPIGQWAVTPASVTAIEVGTAAEGLAAGTVLCASFHAG
jgi:hypothetical protein